MCKSKEKFLRGVNFLLIVTYGVGLSFYYTNFLVAFLMPLLLKSCHCDLYVSKKLSLPSDAILS